MRVTMLGHATLLVEAGVNVLMDPWLSAPSERRVDVCPRRVAHVERLPPLDALVIPHAHGDHFDPGSLELLPSRPPVFCADDPGMRRELAALGFRDVKPLVPGRPLQVGPLTLHPTASAEAHVEVGVVFAADALVWNHVDSVITQAEVLRVLRLFDRPFDAAFVGYNPILEHTLMWPEEHDFPRERYERLLETALATGARVLVPGSSQERRSDELTPFNHRLFPVTASRFAADIQTLAPGQRVQPLLPGQALVLGEGEARVEESRLVTRIAPDDSADILFDPARAVPPLRDASLMGASTAALRNTVRAVMLHHFPERAQALLTKCARGPLRHLADRRHPVVMRFWLPGEPAAVDYRIGAWWPVEVAELQAGASGEPWHYRFEYLASEIHARATEQANVPITVRAFRNRAATGPLPPLDPARLNDIDAYFTVDTTYDWHPLEVFAD